MGLFCFDFIKHGIIYIVTVRLITKSSSHVCSYWSLGSTCTNALHADDFDIVSSHTSTANNNNKKKWYMVWTWILTSSGLVLLLPNKNNKNKWCMIGENCRSTVMIQRLRWFTLLWSLCICRYRRSYSCISTYPSRLISVYLYMMTNLQVVPKLIHPLRCSTTTCSLQSHYCRTMQLFRPNQT